MFKLSHTTLILLSGLIWLAIGCFLFFLGINFLVESILKENLVTLSRPVLDRFASFAGGLEQAVLFLIALCIAIGYLKSRFIFAKTVHKGVHRIRSLPNPASLSSIYTKKYYILLASMGLIGFLVRFAPLDVRGAVDVAIGTALIVGAVLYFRSAFEPAKKKLS